MRKVVGPVNRLWPLRLGICIAALLVAVGTGKTALAATATWNVYPGFAVSGIYDYGWHFDEGSPQWGARDYNYSGDAGGSIVFSAKLTQNSSYQIRWRFEQFGSCGVKVIAQANFFGWVDIANTEMHYIHLTNRVSTGTTTGVVQNNGQAVFNFLGNAGGVGSGSEHVHQSADFSSSTRVAGQRFGTDTCWTDTDDFTGTNLYQCPGTFKTHTSAPTCPPGAWNGSYWLLTGNVAQYQCETWSNISQSYTAPAFKATW